MSSSGQARSLAHTIGANVRLARKAQGLTQRELALELGGKIDGQRISDWERGAYRPSDPSLLLLSSVLGRDLPWFYTDHQTVAA